MKNKARVECISIKTLWKMFLKNIFSVFYFMIVCLVLSIIYTQFLLKPSFKASGNIENVGSFSSGIMPAISTIAKEQETLEEVTDRMNIPANEKDDKIASIRSRLVVSDYSVTTLKVNIVYRSTSKVDAELVVEHIIDVSIERFIERNPAAEGKVKKQGDPIVAVSTNAPNAVIYAGFIVVGALFGVTVGILGDLVNRRLLFADDFEIYSVAYNIIDLKCKKGDKVPSLKTKEFLQGTIVLQDQLEGVVRDKKAKVIGVVNLGYSTYDVLSAFLAENIAQAGLKTLVIDLDLEHPRIAALYNIDEKTSITNLLNDKVIKPIRIKDDLDIIPTKEYTYPARFLKDERLHKLIKENAEKYDYVFIKIPTVDYYAPILFNFDLIDILLINTSFEGTKMKTLDKYIENLDLEHRSKIFINGVDSRFKKDYSEIIDKVKGVFKRNKKAEDKK